MNTILVAVDGYEPSMGAAKKAIELAGKYEAKVIALQVDEKTPLLPTEKSAESSKGREIISGHPLRVVAEYGSKMGIDVQLLKSVGVVTGTILQVANKFKVDIIIIGDSARKGLEKMHFGSVAESVLRSSRTPVLVVKRGNVDISDLRQLAGQLAIYTDNDNQEKTKILSSGLQEIWRRNFCIAFGFFVAFTLLYFSTAIVNTIYYQKTATLLLAGVPLGVWVSFAVFPLALILCGFFLRVGR